MAQVGPVVGRCVLGADDLAGGAELGVTGEPREGRLVERADAVVGAAGRCGEAASPALGLLDDERAELKRVFLRPEFRGSGAAARIVGAAEDQARLLRATRMVLDARTDFVAARALYQRLGYAEIEPYTFGPYAEHWFGKAL